MLKDEGSAAVLSALKWNLALALIVAFGAGPAAEAWPKACERLWCVNTPGTCRASAFFAAMYLTAVPLTALYFVREFPRKFKVTVSSISHWVILQVATWMIFPTLLATPWIILAMQDASVRRNAMIRSLIVSNPIGLAFSGTLLCVAAAAGIWVLFRSCSLRVQRKTPAPTESRDGE